MFVADVVVNTSICWVGCLLTLTAKISRISYFIS